MGIDRSTRPTRAELAAFSLPMGCGAWLALAILAASGIRGLDPNTLFTPGRVRVVHAV